MKMQIRQRVISIVLTIAMLATFLAPVVPMKASAVPANHIQNEYIDAYFEFDGQFSFGTMEGDPLTSTDNNKKLLYGWSTGSTSDTLLSINGSTTFFSAESKTFSADGLSCVATDNIGNILVTQKVSIEYNAYTQRYDVFKIQYEMKNNGSTAANIGTRVMLDTMLGDNDHAPFRVPGYGNITTRTEFTGNNIPQYFTVMDDLSYPTVVASGTLYTNTYGEDKPDKLQLTNWGSLSGSTTFNLSVDATSSIGDSAVAVYWNPKSVAVGETRTVSFYYGMGSFEPSEFVEGSLNAALTAPAELLLTYDEQAYQMNPFTVEARIENQKNSTVDDVQVTISLPEELTLSSGDATRTISVASGAEESVSFMVDAPVMPVEKTYSYQVTVNSSALEAPIVFNKTIRVPSAKCMQVTYDANGGSGDVPVDAGIYRSGDSISVQFNAIPERENHTFLGWSRERNASEAEFTESGDCTFVIGEEYVVLYAVWQANAVDGEADVWDGTASSGFGGGTGTQSDPYLIYTAEQLAYLAQRTNAGTTYSGKYFKLMNNLDLNNLEWTPIGFSDTKYFAGNFDGNYHTISNMCITGDREFSGLFGVIKDNKISRLGVTAGVIDTYYHLDPVFSGILCGYTNDATVENCFTTGEISTVSNKYENGLCVKAGMLVGAAYNTRFQNCYAQGTVYGKMTRHWNAYVGGLVGNCGSYSYLTNCYFSGTIVSDGYEKSFAGGISGIGYAQISNCFTTGSITVDTPYSLAPFSAYSSWGTASVSNSYYSLDTNRSFTDYQGYSTSADNFKSQSWIVSNLGWDFTNTWAFRAGNDYPVLRGFGEIVEHTHNYIATVVPETCTADGYTLYECACGHSYQAEIVPMLPHIPGEWIVDREPTCTESGLKHTNCTVCGTRIEDVYMPPLGHNYSSVVIREVTCELPGIIRYTCGNCGDWYDEYIYAEHSYVISAFVPATCESDGYTTYTCTVCGDSYNEIIPGGHHYVAEITKIATAEQEGEITYTCSICGHSYTETIPARPDARVLLIQDNLPWTENNNVSLLNKMMEEGYLAGWDITTTRSFDAADLAGYGVVLIANDQTTATYNQLRSMQDALIQFANAGGVVIYGACDNGWAGGNINHTLPQGTTKRNFYSHYNYIVDADHPIVTGVNTDGKALTNTLLYGNYCSHTAFFNLPADANVILQDGHGDPTLVEYAMGDGHIILSGLTWEFYYVREAYNGYSDTTYTKNVYDDLVFYALQLSDSCDHAYDSGEAVYPTCTENGYTLHTCQLCGGTMKDNATEALCHIEGEWEIRVEATTEQTGLKVLFCARCDEVIGEEVIPMLDAPVVSLIAQTDPVILGQTFEVYVVIADCDPVKSVAFVPEYDESIFELVSVQWQKEAMIQIVDPRITSAWMTETDVNGTLLKLTFRAKSLTSGSVITSEAMIQNGGLISLSVVGDMVAVIECPHAEMVTSALDDTYHTDVCVICGFATVSVHTYDHSCDTTCNECEYVREITHTVGDQAFDTENHWNECTVCGELLNVTAHSFDHDCDTTCNECAYTRTITHTPGDVAYNNQYHWNICAVCGAIMNLHGHTFDHDCDTTCNLCDYVREITHTPGEQVFDTENHWYECTVCGELLDVTAHTYDNSCDTTCNDCDYVREITHTLSGEWLNDESQHWQHCAVCGETIALDNHQYDGLSDCICNDCGYCRVLRGDVNGDNVVDSDDAIYLLLYTYFADEYPLNQDGDMNGDGVVNSDDSIYLLLHTYFADEYPLFYPAGY